MQEGGRKSSKARFPIGELWKHALVDKSVELNAESTKVSFNFSRKEGKL
jgi:hypothetical protein